METPSTKDTIFDELAELDNSMVLAVASNIEVLNLRLKSVRKSKEIYLLKQNEKNEMLTVLGDELAKKMQDYQEGVLKEQLQEFQTHIDKLKDKINEGVNLLSNKLSPDLTNRLCKRYDVPFLKDKIENIAAQSSKDETGFPKLSDEMDYLNPVPPQWLLGKNGVSLNFRCDNNLSIFDELMMINNSVISGITVKLKEVCDRLIWLKSTGLHADNTRDALQNIIVELGQELPPEVSLYVCNRLQVPCPKDKIAQALALKKQKTDEAAKLVDPNSPEVVLDEIKKLSDWLIMPRVTKIQNLCEELKSLKKQHNESNKEKIEKLDADISLFLKLLRRSLKEDLFIRFCKICDVSVPD